ncbi:MAG: zinc ribbon domain-containing protein [Burkholderia sp.]
MTLHVYRCEACGHTLFPARYRCPSCGQDRWREVACTRGHIAETTVVRHRAGVADVADVALASVVGEAGPILIARLDALLPEGTAVSLEIDAEGRIAARGLAGALNPGESNAD